MIGVQHVTNTANIHNENSIFNIITYLLLNSDRVCVLSTWFGDICGSRRDLYVLQKVTITLFQILFVAAAYEQTNVMLRVRKAAVHRNAPAIGRRPPVRRQRTVPCDLPRASLPVPPLF